jgi:MFS family permease
MDNIKHQKAQVEQRVVFAATAAHLLTHAYMMIFPTVLVLIASDPLMGINQYFQLGIIGTVCYGLFGIGAIPSGVLADRYGSQKMLVICVFGSALSSLAAGLSSSLYLFVASMMFLGLAASIYHPSGLSFISRNVEKKGKAMGYHGVGGNVGLALGPILSGAVAAWWGWRSAFLLFGVLGLILGVIIARLNTVEEISTGEAGKKRGAVKLGLSSMPVVLLLIYINCMLYGLCYRGAMMYFPKHFTQNIHFALNDVGKAGFLVFLVTMAGTLGQLLGGILCDKLKKPEYSYLLVFLFSTPLFFAIWQFKDWGLLAISILFAPFFFAWQPIQNTMIAKYTAQAAHGLSFGVNFLLIMGVGSLAASLGGYITDNLGVASVFAVLGFISGLSLLLVFYILKAVVFQSPASEASEVIVKT